MRSLCEQLFVDWEIMDWKAMDFKTMDWLTDLDLQDLDQQDLDQQVSAALVLEEQHLEEREMGGLELKALEMDRLEADVLDMNEANWQAVDVLNVTGTDWEDVDLAGLTEVSMDEAEAALASEVLDLDGFELVELMPEEEPELGRLAFEDFALDRFDLEREQDGLVELQKKPLGFGELWVHPLAVDAAIAVFDWVDELEAAERSLLMTSLVESAWSVCIQTARAWEGRAEATELVQVLKAAVAEVTKVQRWLEFGVANGYGADGASGGSEQAGVLYRRYGEIGLALTGLVMEVSEAGDAWEVIAA